MTTEAPAEAEAGGGVHAGKKKDCCSMGDKHFPKDEVRKIWKECQEESFWYRALPLSLGSMGVSGGLMYSGVWKQSKRFGPFPKLALAGIIGYVVGKASYMGTCREKFQKLGPDFCPVGPGWCPWFGPPMFGGCHHRHCKHVCQECKTLEEAGTATAKPS